MSAFPPLLGVERTSVDPTFALVESSRHLQLVGYQIDTKPMISSAKSKPAKTKRDDPAQSRAFIKKAREIGADEQRSAADELLGKLAKTPPEPRTKQKRRA
jgi:hypothetical protein